MLSSRASQRCLARPSGTTPTPLSQSEPRCGNRQAWQAPLRRWARAGRGPGGRAGAAQAWYVARVEGTGGRQAGVVFVSFLAVVHGDWFVILHLRISFEFHGRPDGGIELEGMGRRRRRPRLGELKHHKTHTDRPKFMPAPKAASCWYCSQRALARRRLSSDHSRLLFRGSWRPASVGSVASPPTAALASAAIPSVSAGEDRGKGI